MEGTQSRLRHSSTPSPRLLRSRSTTPGTAPPENNSCRPNSGQKVVKPRPNSTTRSRTNRNEENISPLVPISSIPKKVVEITPTKEGFGKFLQRGSPRPVGASRGPRPVTNSPSAWALSPGRSLGFPGKPESPGRTLGLPSRPEPPGSGGRRVKDGVNGVLKYFKQKKVSATQTEDFQQFRILHNRLLQWRFVNARAEAAMAGVKKVAEAKIFSVWIRIFRMRKTIAEKQIQMQKLRLQIKLYQVLSPQIFLLNEWEKLEKRNQESISRLTRKLSGISVRLPLVQGAKADVVAVYQALSMALEVMDSIVATITKFFSKIETLYYLFTELKCTLERDEEYLEEIETAVTLVATLLAKEESIQVHLIQAAKDSSTGRSRRGILY